MGRVDVLADPDAGVAEDQARGRGPGLELADVAVGRGNLLGEPDLAVSIAHALEPLAEQPVIVVARDENDLLEVGADCFEERPGDLHRRLDRPVAEFDRVAEQHEPLAVRGRLEQPLEHLRAAQQVDLGARAEVQVGDHGGAHRAAMVARADNGLARR